MRKMKLPVIDKTGKKISEIDVKTQSIRDDIFKKAVLAENSLFTQPKGADPQAGRRQTVHVSKRRRALRSTYGKGGSRSPRKVMWSRGIQFRFVGAFAANTVGGRRAHPPKAEKNTLKTINNKEWIKALQTGFSASLDKSIVQNNGQRVSSSYPFVLDKSAEEISKTKDARSLVESLGLSEELQRLSNVKIRAGKGTMRGRKTRVKRGPLFVVSSLEAPLLKSLRNLKGVDVITSDLVMASDFGMSEKPGRAVIFTKEALEQFQEVFE